ncbi:hypothetical protein ACFSKM_07960 [Ancylobacter dichloromethanicus]
MLAALDLLAPTGTARRVPRGWRVHERQADFIAPATMDALETRGLVAPRQAGAMRVITREGRQARQEGAGRAA